MSGLSKPIFLIGAARSGTSLIADILGTHPDVAYWIEPKYVWRYGNAGAADDVRGSDEATPAIRAYVERTFADRTRRQGKARFLEKTPSNCFRIPFMHRVFPSGRFLHLVRNGEDAAASALARWRSPPDDKALLRRLLAWEVPVGETAYYLADIFREGVLRRLRPRRGYVWGPQYPGIHDDAQHLDTPTLCAKQWAESIRTAVRDLARLPADQVCTFRYEDFIAHPAQLLQTILDFAELTRVEDVVQAARAVRPAPRDKLNALPAFEQEAIRAICEPAARELGLARL